MTELMALCLAVIFAVAEPGSAILTPRRLYDLGFTSSEPLRCRVPNDGEKRLLGLEPKGKAATFSINGAYLCERNIFDYGDRDSYTDFVLGAADDYSLQLARRAKLLSDTESDLTGRTWTVAVRPSEGVPDIKLATIFRSALSQSLGPGRVSRLAQLGGARLSAQTRSSTKDHVHVEIVVRPTVDSDILFAAILKTETSRGTLTWQM